MVENCNFGIALKRKAIYAYFTNNFRVESILHFLTNIQIARSDLESLRRQVSRSFYLF